MNRGYPDLCKNDSHSHASLKHDPNTHKKDGEAELLFKNALHKYHGTLLFTCGTQVQVSTLLWNASLNPTMSVLKKCIEIAQFYKKCKNDVNNVGVVSLLLMTLSMFLQMFEHRKNMIFFFFNIIQQDLFNPF